MEITGQQAQEISDWIFTFLVLWGTVRVSFSRYRTWASKFTLQKHPAEVQEQIAPAAGKVPVAQFEVMGQMASQMFEQARMLVDMSGELSGLRSELDLVKAAGEEYVGQIQELQEQLKAKEAELANVQAQLTKEQLHNAALTAQMAQLSDEVQQLRAELAAYKSDQERER